MFDKKQEFSYDCCIYTKEKFIFRKVFSLAI